MVNKDNQAVCDYTSIIVNDGVTIFPGYCEIKDGVLYRHDTTDPMNELAIYKPWILHNRIKYQYTAHQEPCDEGILQGKHFISKIAMDRYLTENK